MWSGGRALAAAALVAVACLAHAPAASAAGCRQGGERVLAENRYVEVVGTGKWNSFSTAFACLKPNGRRFSFDTTSDQDLTVHTFKLRGRYVVFDAHWSFGEEEARELNLLNVRTGSVHLLDVTDCFSCDDFSSFALKPNGSTAWIVNAGDKEFGETVDLVRSCPRATCLRTRQKTPRTLDPGPGVRPGSLSLTGSRLSWVRSGKRRTATLR